jgi:hypothetical protein
MRLIRGRRSSGSFFTNLMTVKRLSLRLRWVMVRKAAFAVHQFPPMLLVLKQRCSQAGWRLALTRKGSMRSHRLLKRLRMSQPVFLAANRQTRSHRLTPSLSISTPKTALYAWHDAQQQTISLNVRRLSHQLWQPTKQIRQRPRSSCTPRPLSKQSFRQSTLSLRYTCCICFGESACLSPNTSSRLTGTQLLNWWPRRT